MVVGAFPIAKLGALLLKQISKPIANAVKEQAKSSPVFKKYVCMPPAQFYNWCEIKTKMWILNLGRPVNVPVLNEAMAMELGANLLGEGLIFLIAAGILISEYSRSYRKETAKEEKKRQEMEQITITMQEFYFTIEKQGTQIRELLRHIHDLESRVVQKPWVSKRDSNPTTEEDHSIMPSNLPPASPIEPVLTLEEVELNEIDHVNIADDETTSNIIMTAVKDLEGSFFSDDDSNMEIGIIATALNYIYEDVYRLPLNPRKKNS